MRVRLTKDAKDWYKMYTVHAATLLAIVEAIQLAGIQDLPDSISIILAIAIPVLRVIDQENMKESP